MLMMPQQRLPVVNFGNDWDELNERGPCFGFYPNDSKTFLLVKKDFEEPAKLIFAGTEVRITMHGKRHLGTALGSPSFTEEYVTDKVQGWVNEIKNLRHSYTDCLIVGHTL